MSVSEIVSPTRTHTNSADKYDHAINLIDTTKPASDQPGSPAESDFASSPSKRRGSDGSLHKRWTKGTLREEIARRKYAKFQEGRYNDEEGAVDSSDTDDGHRGAGGTKPRKRERAKAQVERVRDKIPFISKKATKAPKQEEYEVDILYENQRGMFFCGIPLYSPKSLLNFDPSPWQTNGFKESPVNITNAQVPDPSWAWAWKSWYVDMSHDVDEEGWEYSLSFRQGFSWHGTHPWFHSFVRRRRWLRKRIKINSIVQPGAKGSMIEAHRLNADYFTIHAAKRERSRESSLDRTTMNRSSLVSTNRTESEADDGDTEIDDVLKLLKALKAATVDRKKNEAFRNFLEHGGDELHYLADNMQEILSAFIYQVSRRQLLADLQHAYADLDVQLEGAGDDGGGAQTRQKLNLLHAIQAADEHVKSFEYWSDVKQAAGNEQESGPPPTEPRGNKQLVGFDEIGPARKSLEEVEMEGSGPVSEDEIRGIPDEAGVGEEPMSRRTTGAALVENEEPSPRATNGTNKGKGKEA